MPSIIFNGGDTCVLISVIAQKKHLRTILLASVEDKSIDLLSPCFCDTRLRASTHF